MLSRAFEWYRIVNANPTSDAIDKRSAAARGVIDAFHQAEDLDLTLCCAAGVVAGFDANFTQDAPVIKTLVGAIRAHDSAFPEDLSENALDLRVCAALALGELLHVDNGPDSYAPVIAALLLSGLGTRPLPNGKYLKQMLDELKIAATKTTAAEGNSRRGRVANLGDQIDKLDEEAASFPKSLGPMLKLLARQSSIDREEIDILWWMFAGTTGNGAPIAGMPVGAAALYCGAKLGTKCLIPAALSIEAMVRRACEAGRKSADLSERSLEKIASEWTDECLTSQVPTDEARRRARAYPSLFPISWLSDRLLASKGSTDWASEFKRMTGIPSSYARTPADWGIQAFRERVADRTLDPGQEN